MIARALLVTVLALTASCDRDSTGSVPQGRLEALSDAGQVSTSLNGVWTVVNTVVLSESEGRSMPAEFPHSAPGEGATVEIVDGRFHRAGTWLMAAPEAVQNPDIYSYLNQVDDRFGYYDLGGRTRPGGGLSESADWRTQFVLGSSSADELIGLFAFESDGMLGRGEGLYRVRLRRQ